MKKNRHIVIAVGMLTSLFLGFAPGSARAEVNGRKKIVLVAGRPSHAPGHHEFNAGCILLKRCLDEIEGLETHLHKGGWPSDPRAFDDADAVILYMDGGGGHPVIQGDHLKIMGALMAKGVGLGCLHYAVEIPKNNGGLEFLDWIGGYYESGYSINPHWRAEPTQGEHPIMNGVHMGNILDEWYYNIRFRMIDPRIKILLSAAPPDRTRKTDGAAAHPGRKEILAWAIERKDGGRGFGFTGAHFHSNWSKDDFRRMILNSILWLAKVPVPSDGVISHIAPGEIKKNLDPK